VSWVRPTAFAHVNPILRVTARLDNVVKPRRVTQRNGNVLASRTTRELWGIPNQNRTADCSVGISREVFRPGLSVVHDEWWWWCGYDNGLFRRRKSRKKEEERTTWMTELYKKRAGIQLLLDLKSQQISGQYKHFTRMTPTDFENLLRKIRSHVGLYLGSHNNGLLF